MLLNIKNQSLMLVIKQLIFGYGRLKIFLGMTDGIMMVARAGISIILFFFQNNLV